MRKMLLLCFLTGYSACTSAQTVRALYTSEGQSNFKKDFNWVNLLRLESAFQWGRHMTAEMATLHIIRSNGKCIADDWQAFSNIESENLPCGIALLGISYATSRCKWFVGIRNVNEDYFTEPGTSLFTNSSNGIFPTLSTSLPLANYPLSAMAVHFVYEDSVADVQASLYNGRAYNGWKKGDNPFHVTPKDGVYGMAEMALKEKDKGYFRTGLGVHYGQTAAGMADGKTVRHKRVRGAWWLYAEHPVITTNKGITHLLLQYSRSFGSDNACRQFTEIGCVTYLRNKGAGRLGLSLQHATFTYGEELSGELTYRHTLNGAIDLQPSFQWIKNSDGRYAILSVRFCLSLNLLSATAPL